VNRFLRDAFGHGAIDVHELTPEKLQLRVGRPRGTPLPLALVGDGVGKALPVVVAAQLLDQAPAQRTGVVLVEDPEAHLHDDATRALGLHLAQLASGWQPGRSLVLETHSRTFVLAVQLAVKRGLISPDRVALVWAGGPHEPTLERIELDVSGAPKGSRLRGAFAEDARLAAEIAGLEPAPAAPAPGAR
jgi:predicted ATPase